MAQTIDKKIEGESIARSGPILSMIGKPLNAEYSPAERSLLGSYVDLKGIDYTCGTCNNCGSGDCNSCCGSTDD